MLGRVVQNSGYEVRDSVQCARQGGAGLRLKGKCCFPPAPRAAAVGSHRLTLNPSIVSTLNLGSARQPLVSPTPHHATRAQPEPAWFVLAKSHAQAADGVGAVPRAPRQENAELRGSCAETMGERTADRAAECAVV